MESKPLTVSELTQEIKNCLEPQFNHIYLEGEVSNFKRQASGHLYFSLKDAHSQISAVMFRGFASHLKQLPREGDKVTIRGEISIYAPRGNYQIVVRELRQAGVGELLLKLEELKKELHKRGWFSPKHKKPLPHLPKKIGIVTSPTGAVIRDILHVLNRRFGAVHVILNPVKVQGEGAAEEIAQAIRQFNQHKLVDVMIVGRGGGSIEDLWAFNEEIVAQAIFESQIPIIGAVGHETDHCIAEYVADARAPTPSAAAEVVMAEKMQLHEALADLDKQLMRSMTQLLSQRKNELRAFLMQPVLTSAYALLGTSMQRLDAMARQLEFLDPSKQIALARERLFSLSDLLNQSIFQLFDRKNQQLLSLQQTLDAINPKNLLKNGYSILMDTKNKRAITSVRSLQKGQNVRLLLSDGEALAEVLNTEKNG